MSSNKVILISPASTKAIDSDVDKLSGLISDIIDMAEKKLDADFSVDIISDIPSLFNKNDCRHVLGILIPGSEKYVNLDSSNYIPANAVIKCARCDTVFSLFRSAEEIKEIAHPDKVDDINGVVCKGNYNDKERDKIPNN